jgi:CRP-like cAMP-binding protein
MAGAPVDLLHRIPLFANLEPADVGEIARLFKRRHFSQGETLTKEGSGGAAFFVIEEGEADVSVKGHPRPPLQAGDHFGEIALIDGGERSATITARSDLVCYGLTYWDFQPLVQARAGIAWGLLQSLAKSLRAAQSDLDG